jgi:hypothetical protein
VVAPSAVTAPPPPTFRDPWAWASLLAIVPVLLHSLGAPLGEPVADDFDFLHHALLLDRHGFWDGGGSRSFWRPLAHQVYYSLLGETILDHPRWVAALHAVLLAGAALVLYRIARRIWSGPVAAAAATFPLLMESARALIAWPSHFVDLGALFFGVLALHEAAFRRLPAALLALLATLLCKENGIVVGLLMPWMPDLGARHAPPRAPGGRWLTPERVRWLAGTGLVLAAYGVAYAWVRRETGMELPHRLENNAEIAAVPWSARFAWALGNGLRAMLSLPATPRAGEIWALAGGGLLLMALAIAGLSARSRVVWRWTAWGSAWVLLFSAGLTAIYPIWAPYRSVFPAVGMGLVAASLGARMPLLLAGLVALRLVAFVASPGPPPRVSATPIESGAFIDFERIVRLQRLMADTRHALQARHPTLPRGALVGQHYLPQRVLYAFEGDASLQLWYRDTTLRWVSHTTFAGRPELALATIAEYQPHRAPQIALVDPPAMRALHQATHHIRNADFGAALGALDRADRLQRDPAALVFRATVIAKRALCRLSLGDAQAARSDAVLALGLWKDNFDSRYVIASADLAAGRLDQAQAQLDTLLAAAPGDRGARELRERVRAAARARTLGP